MKDTQPFRLQTQPDRLFRGSEAVALRPKSLSVLVYLASRTGRLVTKEELREHRRPSVDAAAMIWAMPSSRRSERTSTHPAGPRRWKTLETGEILDRHVFGLQEVVRRSPRTGRAATYQVLRIGDWANVVALTPGDEVVLVAQYRHGLDAVTLEIPGGVLDPGEDGAACAARELAEETGYTGEPPVLLGTVHPNPAIQDNACTTWLITGARRTREPTPDDGEDIEVLTVPRREVSALLRQGRITHSLVVAAFHWLDLYDAGPML